MLFIFVLFVEFKLCIWCCSCDFEGWSRWKITIRPPLSPVASSSPSSLNSTVEIISASLTSSSIVPLTCEKYHWASPPESSFWVKLVDLTQWIQIFVIMIFFLLTSHLRVVRFPIQLEFFCCCNYGLIVVVITPKWIINE